MQKVSYMRRSGTYKGFIDSAILVGFLLVYDAISSLNLFLPPLFGILFLSFVRLLESNRYYSLLALILTLCVMEANKGFSPGSLLIVYALVYMFVFNRIVKMFKYVNIFEIFYILIIYALFVLLDSLLSAFAGKEVYFSPMILYYIFIETLMLVARWIFGIK